MIRVLLVDDHKLVRDGIKWMLSNEPSVEVVGEVSSGGELFDLLTEVEVDVVLLDIRMPGMSGLEIMADLSQRSEPPRVLMLSMYDEPGLVQQAIKLGASGYLKKSAGRDELVKAIQVVAGGKPYLQGELTLPLMAQIGVSPTAAPQLSEEDRSILELMALGQSNREIAMNLGVEERELLTAVQSLLSRLGVHSRSEAVAIALRRGAID
ncbi:MAG: response regulator transcription factor [Acidimicrobiia bacterium]